MVVLFSTELDEDNGRADYIIVCKIIREMLEIPELIISGREEERDRGRCISRFCRTGNIINCEDRERYGK